MMKHLFLTIFALVFAATDIQAQRIKGSDTVLPIAQQTAERFMTLNPNARVTVTGGGSGVGISALLDETTDIAMASRGIKFSEKMKAKAAGEELEEIPVAYDALAVVVHPSNPVKQLTRRQLEDIFRGKITNWKQVGGDDRKIVVYSRETSSGTYEFFKESVLKNKNYMSSSLPCPPPEPSYNPSAKRAEPLAMWVLPMYRPASRPLPYLTTTSTLLLPPWKTPSIKLIPSYARYIIITIRKAPAL
jgi:phosphate transport system substrate-binding protein